MTGALNTAMGSAALAWRRARAQERIAPSFALALVMHLALFVAMSLAVRWKTEAEAPAMAELWSALPPIAAPAPPPPKPVEPEPVVEPKPEPKVEPPPDIAIEPAKKLPPKKEEPKKVEAKKVEAKKEEPKKVEKIEPKKTTPPEEQVDTERERILAQADATRAALTGPARSAGSFDASYSAAVNACVRPNIIFSVPEGTPASVFALFRVELLPDGTVARLSLVKPSGLAGYDDAALRAIRRCDPFPRKPGVMGSWAIDLTLRPVETQ